MYRNIRPKQIKPIPWGWKNAEHNGRVFVKEPLGKIEMPNLVEYFSWTDYEYEESNERLYGTRDMKSLFQTAVRFLGFEQALIKLYEGTLELDKIFQGFYAWNTMLLETAPVDLTFFEIGDEYASNTGLLMSPGVWCREIKPYLMKLIELAFSYNLTIIMHNDGDVSELLEDYENMNVDILHYEKVGRMKDPDTYLLLWENTTAEEPYNGYAPEVHE